MSVNEVIDPTYLKRYDYKMATRMKALAGVLILLSGSASVWMLSDLFRGRLPNPLAPYGGAFEYFFLVLFSFLTFFMIRLFIKDSKKRDFVYLYHDRLVITDAAANSSTTVRYEEVIAVDNFRAGPRSIPRITLMKKDLSYFVDISSHYLSSVEYRELFQILERAVAEKTLKM